MKLSIFLASVFFANICHGALFIQPEFGISFGAVTQNRTATTQGLKAGINFGYKFDKIIPVVELQYHRFSSTAIENESIELQSFPIGGGIKYELLDKYVFSYAFYFDNALYKNLIASPLGYSYVFESNNSWRAGVGYKLNEKWQILVHYEKYFLNKIKYKQPVPSISDLVTAIEMHFVAVTAGYTF